MSRIRVPKMPPLGPPMCFWCGRIFATEAERDEHQRAEEEAEEREDAAAAELVGDWQYEGLLERYAFEAELAAERRAPPTP